MKKGWRYWSRFFHKWLSLLLGAQVFLWFLSGTVMSFLPIEQVRGKHLLKETSQSNFELGGLFSLSKIDTGSPISSVELKARINEPIYIFHYESSKEIYSATTGERIPSLTEYEISELVGKRLNTTAPPVEVSLRTSETREFKGELPVWRLDYEYPETFSIYASPLSGDILAIRNDKWRIFDFFWMLHIMDYVTRENINSPWLVVLAGLSLFLTVTGFFLIWATFRKRNTHKAKKS